MDNYLEYEADCPVCGHLYKGKRLSGYYVNHPADLDTNPHHPAVFDRVTICPVCGYAAEDLRKPADEPVRTMVGSGLYQRILHDSILSENTRKMLLHSMICETAGSLGKAAYSALCAYWSRKEEGIKDPVILKRAETLYKEYLTKTQDVDAAVLLIDIQRQAGNFEEAAETAGSLLPFVQDPYRRAVIRFEQELIFRKDSESHSQAEVAKG
ncbi:MAG: hypothetical protein E7240_10365 [Lachnospiraceae bacterium]|nr:hypothetical protein [Lachnospiraceae bacterium]